MYKIYYSRKSKQWLYSTKRLIQRLLFDTNKESRKIGENTKKIIDQIDSINRSGSKKNINNLFTRQGRVLYDRRKFQVDITTNVIQDRSTEFSNTIIPKLVL